MKKRYEPPTDYTDSDRTEALAKLDKAKQLRASGLSVLAAANATGLNFCDVERACIDIHPAFTLPDLPGLTAPKDAGPRNLWCEVTPVDSALIYEMRKARHTQAEIAAALGISVATVGKHIKGVKRGAETTPEALAVIRPYRLPLEKHKELHRLLNAGATVASVSNRLGVSRPTVIKYRKLSPK